MTSPVAIQPAEMFIEAVEAAEAGLLDEAGGEDYFNQAFTLCIGGIAAVRKLTAQGDPSLIWQLPFPLLQAEIIARDPRVRGVQEATEVHAVLKAGMPVKPQPSYAMTEIDRIGIYCTRSALLLGMSQASMTAVYRLRSMTGAIDGHLVARAHAELNDAYEEALATNDQETVLAVIAGALKTASYLEDIRSDNGLWKWQDRLNEIRHRNAFDMKLGGNCVLFIAQGLKYIQGPYWAERDYNKDPYGFAAHQLINLED